MSNFLIIAFLFFVGSIVGWLIEVVFRKYFSSENKEHRWINPGFLTGPYLPLYGSSLCVLFLLARIDINFTKNIVLSKIILFLIMALVVTLIEYLAGLIFIKGMKIKLWDYSNNWGNINGIICPEFSFFWAILSAIYYFFIDPYILDSLHWLSNHLTFSFIMGFFYGIFVIDFAYSMHLVTRIRKFAQDNDIVVKYELLKQNIRKRNEEVIGKKKFIFAIHTGREDFMKHLKSYKDEELKKIKAQHKIIKEKIKK